MKILFIQTGGTIDKDYPQKSGYAFEIREPAATRILEKIKPDFEFESVSLMKKDSTDIDDKDREKLFQYCKKSKYENIILTHGTDTMVDTASKLSAIKDKKIILTGAFHPERFQNSDADFNIGTAIGAINTAKPGIYIAMNGRVFEWDKCKRDSGNRFVDK